MRGYSVNLREASKELTKREILKLTDTSDAIKLDDATAEENVIIDVDYFAIVDIHNENSRGGEKDYVNYIIVDKNGAKYVTGSESFWDSFSYIADVMEGEEYAIVAYRIASKNYAGKSFITCSVQ